MRESVKMIVVLTVIAMVSAGVLSVVYDFTSGIIQANLAQELEGAITRVLSNVDSVRTIDEGSATLVEEDRSTLREYGAEGDLLLFEAFNAEGSPVGFAYVSQGTGYAGVVRILVGVDVATMEISGIEVLEHLETPGLGSRIEADSFRNQFVGKDKDDPIQLNQDIDNISGATVSARAVTEGVRSGMDWAVILYEGGRTK